MIQDHTGGIVGGIQNDGLGSGGNEIFQGIALDLEPGFGQIQGNHGGTGNGSHALIQAEAGNRHDDLLPRIQNAQQRRENGLGSTDGDQHLLRLYLFRFRNGLAQILHALVGGIEGMIGLQGRHRPILNGLRGFKIRFSDGQLDAAGGGICQVGVGPDGTLGQGFQISVQRNHSLPSAKVSKKSAPFSRTDSSKSKLSVWSAGTSPNPRKKNTPGTCF